MRSFSVKASHERNRIVRRSGLALVVLTLAACADQGASNSDVSLGEFWVTPTSRVFEAGTIELLVGNDGKYSHTLVVSDASGTVIGATDLISPETETLLTLSLQPGTYMFTCRIVKGQEDGTVVDHYQEGMAASVEVVA